LTSIKRVSNSQQKMNPYAKEISLGLIRIQAQQKPSPYTPSTFIVDLRSRKFRNGGFNLTIHGYSTMILSRVLFGLIKPKDKQKEISTDIYEILTRVAVNAALHPLSLLTVWQHLKHFETSSVATIATISNTKSLYDGVVEHAISDLAYMLINYTLKRTVMKRLPTPTITDDKQSPRSFLNSVLNKFCTLWTYSTLIDHTAKIIVFPLVTIRYKIEAQGVSFELPARFKDGFDCATFFYKNYGIAGFYNGVDILALSVLPELICIGGVYSIFRLIIAQFSNHLNSDEEPYVDFVRKNLMPLLQ
jgi:hypothetical protein